ncbi:hypothetical protein GCM10009678_94460 [Actinomadura kijaniata]|uniref:Uncharacterized protein n=1 Tax=Actinomadura namibiensis TaxID=182080 RepID=A0A7W3QPI4_ACTNM|nr:hypothetical protein [Actinomadura namibiensis]MBA8954715.1 hypothetical protein [Actinomadura namibiensis]
MSAVVAERWYRVFLRAFPSRHRAEYGAEILGTLMNDAPRRPSPRETAGLVTAGLTARAREAAGRPVPWWADGLHLGLLVIALANLSYNVSDRVSPGWLAVSAALVVALLRGWAPAVLPLALVVALSTGRVMLFGIGAASWSPLLGPAYHNWVSLIPYGALAGGAVVLAARRSRDLRVRPWWWLAIPALALVLAWAPGGWRYGEVWQAVKMGTEGVVLLAGIAATAVARSPRWALAAALYVLPGVVSALTYPPMSARYIAYWLTLTALLLTMAVTARRPAAGSEGAGT